jgi:hypothetical protein
VKWLTDTDHHRRVVDALSEALDLLGFARYAALCRSPTTAAVLDAYERSEDEGIRAFHKADVASGIRPPDLDELAWGSVMGCGRAPRSLQRPSSSNWRSPAANSSPAREVEGPQQNPARAHLSSARLELAGRSWLDVVREERLETWLLGRRSPTRRRLLQPLAAQLRREERLPAGVEDPVAPLRWLLGELAGGQTLTQTGNLNRAFVQDAAGRFGWWDAGLHGLPRSEDELYDLHEVRRLAQRLGLIRRSGRTLGLTTNGRAALDDRERLWRGTATGLLPAEPFELAVGEATLAMLLITTTVPADDLHDTVTTIVHEEGWRDQRSGAPPDRHVISRATHTTTNLLRALNLLAIGGDWRDHAYGLTPAGRSIAQETLRR